MEANKKLGFQLFIETLFTVAFIVIILVGGYITYAKFKTNSTYSMDNVMIDIDTKNAPSKLYSMSESAGIKTKPYVLTITNNNDTKVSYKLYINHNLQTTVNVNEYLIVSVDDVIVKKLGDFKPSNRDMFIILEEELEPGCTSIHRVKLWFDVSSPNIVSGVDANINFTVEGE